MADKIFKKGFIPLPGQIPPERTHKRARLIYNIIRVILWMAKEKQAAALKEIKDCNPDLHDRCRHYMDGLTEQQIYFWKHPEKRPQWGEDGKMEIYHPQFDNPVMMSVFDGENPDYDNIIDIAPRKVPLWAPGIEI